MGKGGREEEDACADAPGVGASGMRVAFAQVPCRTPSGFWKRASTGAERLRFGLLEAADNLASRYHGHVNKILEVRQTYEDKQKSQTNHVLVSVNQVPGQCFPCCSSTAQFTTTMHSTECHAGKRTSRFGLEHSAVLVFTVHLEEPQDCHAKDHKG
jgi:hypothetical protein